MFIIMNGNKLLEENKELKFKTEDDAKQYLFNHNFYLCKGIWDGELKEVWNSFYDGMIFYCYDLKIIKINSENDIVEEIANLINSIESKYNLVINSGNKIVVTDENGYKFVLTCNKEQEEN